MFDNVGEKIKLLSELIAFMGMIISDISGILFWLMTDANFIWGIVIIAGGSLLFWIVALLLYGYGHLICNSDKSIELQTIKK